MADWKPNEKFLDYVLKRMEQEGMDTHQPLVGNSQGTSNARDMVEEMRTGTRVGKKMYESLFEREKKEFEKYLGQQKP